MFDFSALAEEFERRADQADQAAACCRSRRGPTPLMDVAELETKADAYRQVASDLRSESGRRRALSVEFTTEGDGVHRELRLTPQADGYIACEEFEHHGGDEPRPVGHETLSAARVALGDATEGVR